MEPGVRNIPSEKLEDLVEVLAPRDGDGRGAYRVLEHEVPSDDPGDELAHRRVRVRIGTACDGNHRREFGVAQAGKRASDAGDDEPERDRRTGPVGDGRG